MQIPEIPANVTPRAMKVPTCYVILICHENI